MVMKSYAGRADEKSMNQNMKIIWSVKHFQRSEVLVCVVIIHPDETCCLKGMEHMIILFSRAHLNIKSSLYVQGLYDNTCNAFLYICAF